MSSLHPPSIAWLRTHHATISSEVLDRLGVSPDQRKRLVQRGLLRRVVDGAYVFGGVEDEEITRCAAVCASRPHLVISGPTASRLWALRCAPVDGIVHVIAPPQSQPCREPWVRPYRTALLFDDEIVRRPDGIRLTSPPRTIVDMARYLDELALASMIDAALHRRVCGRSTLQRTAIRLASPGRPWARRFLAILDGRSSGSPTESHVERRVFDALTARGIEGLVRQLKIVLPGYGPARFDLALPELRWALEIDVHPSHHTLTGVLHDSVRDDCAEVAGWQTRRVGELELAEQFDGTLERLISAIGRRATQVEALRAAGRWPANGST